ncbi:MAG: spore maturation protein, partial [Bacteroidia bacterium]
MALSRIWSAFIVIAITVAAFNVFVLGDKLLFTRMVTGENGMIETCTTAVNISIKLIGIMALF